MKNRKLISVLSTTAMVASMLSAFAATANAADSVLYSNNFNGYEKDKALAVSYTTQDGTYPAAWQNAAKDNEVFANLIEWATPSSYNMTNKDGKTVSIVCGKYNDDDTSAVYVREVESGNNYISLPRARFSHKNGGLSISGLDRYEANSGEDLLVSFKINMTNGKQGADGSGAEYSPDINIGDIGVLAVDGSDIVSGTWYDVRVVIPASGETKVYVNGTEKLSKEGGSLKGGLTMVNNDGDTKGNPYPQCGIDDLVIMSVASGTGSTATVPAADTVSPDEAPEVTPTEAPTAAPLEDKNTFDFESDETSLAVPTGTNFTASVVDSTNGTKALQVAATSEDDSKYANAALDISSYTKGKSHVKISFDSYIPNTGRMLISLLETAPSAYNDGGLFSLGIRDSDGYRVNGAVNAAGADAWVNTVVDIDFAHGTGTYTVTKDDEPIGTGTLSVSAQEVNSINFLSWSTNTSLIDNIVIETGGSHEIETVDPETPSDVAGSGLNLVPEDAPETISTYAAAEKKEVLNHATAGVAVSTTNTEISAYSASARGYSIYAIYDIYMTPESSFSITPYGDSGNAQASTMKLTTNNKGEVTVSAIVDGGKTVTADNTLVHGTWYRVLVEVPQGGSADAGTTTGELTYTIYRIDPKDPMKAKEVAAQLTGLSSRGIATRGVTSVGLTTEGTVYIDNMSVFRASTGYDLVPVKWYSYVATYDTSGVLTGVTATEVEDPSSVVKNDTDTTKTFVWNNKMTPYVAAE